MLDFQQQLDRFFQDNDRGYPRDPRRMAYAKLKKNVAGMNEDEIEAFIKANLFIPHSQYKMALANLIQLMNKRNQASQLSEVRQFQKIAGLLKEDDYSDDNNDSDERSDDESDDTDAMGGINETGDGNVKKKQEYARYVNGFISQNEDDLNDVYEKEGYLAALKIVRDKVAVILHNAGKYEYPTAQGGIGDNFPLVDAITTLFKQMGYKRAHKGSK